MALSIRKREQLRVRQPLKKILLPVLYEGFKDKVEPVKEIIKAETNVKDIIYIENNSGVIVKKIKPNFKTLGKRLGNEMKLAASVISGFSQEDIAKVEQDKFYDIEINGKIHRLTLQDFEITAEDVPGLLLSVDADLIVALDVKMTGDLFEEGMAREVVNRIQGIRRDKEFNITDRIIVTIQDHERVNLHQVLENYGEYIKNEVLADDIRLDKKLSNGEHVLLPITNPNSLVESLTSWDIWMKIERTV